MIFERVSKDNCKSMLKLKRGLEGRKIQKIACIIFRKEGVMMESSKNETLNVI